MHVLRKRVPPAVLANAVSATIEGSGVLAFTALAVLDVDGDELLNPAMAKVLLGTGVDVVMIPVVLEDVDASTLVLTDVADDDMLLFNACVDGLGVAVLVILEEVDDVNCHFHHCRGLRCASIHCACSA